MNIFKRKQRVDFIVKFDYKLSGYKGVNHLIDSLRSKYENVLFIYDENYESVEVESKKPNGLIHTDYETLKRLLDGK